MPARLREGEGIDELIALAREQGPPPPREVAPEILRLRALVDGCGLTRTDVAGRAGLAPGNLTRLLSGARNPSVESVRRVLVALGCEWADLDPIR